MANGLGELQGVGLGFVLVKREVFERLIAAYPERWIEDEQLYDLFPTGAVGGRYEGEDIGFCRLWRDCGGDVWVDPSVRLQHVGSTIFDGDPMTLFGISDV